MDKIRWPKLVLAQDMESPTEDLSQIIHAQGGSQEDTMGQFKIPDGHTKCGSKLAVDEYGMVIEGSTQESDLINTQETKFMDTMSTQSIDEVTEEILQQPWVSSAKKKKDKKKGAVKVVVATRTSSRVPKDGRTVMEKAIQRTQDKNDTSKGMCASNPFLVLNSLDNEYINDVAPKLDLTIENIDTQLEVFRAEERVRGALAEANYKEDLASVNKKTSPQGEEELQEFSLDVIDNSARDVEVLSR
jgi:hypothetical protein